MELITWADYSMSIGMLLKARSIPATVFKSECFVSKSPTIMNCHSSICSTSQENGLVTKFLAVLRCHFFSASQNVHFKLRLQWYSKSTKRWDLQSISRPDHLVFHKHSCTILKRCCCQHRSTASLPRYILWSFDSNLFVLIGCVNGTYINYDSNDFNFA